jgi:putative NADH-flavin reductase
MFFIVHDDHGTRISRLSGEDYAAMMCDEQNSFFQRERFVLVVAFQFVRDRKRS